MSWGVVSVLSSGQCGFSEGWGRGQQSIISATVWVCRHRKGAQEGGGPLETQSVTPPGVSLGPDRFLHSESETDLDSTPQSINCVISSVR